MDKSLRWIILFLAVLLVGFVVVGFPMLIGEVARQTTERALSPVQQANDQLKTQVSQLLNPTPTIIPDPVTIIREVRSLARLETIQYTVEKVITAEIGQNEFRFLFGDRLLFVAHGKVIAGVDLSRMVAQDLKLEGGVLYVQLPDPEVFIATLDNDKSYVYDRDTGLFSRGDKTLETQARQVAEQEMLKAALEDGILDIARQNAENYLSRLFRALGYDEVIFVQVEPDD